MALHTSAAFYIFEPHITRLFVGRVLLGPLELLGGAQVVLLGELEVPQKLGVHPLHLVLLLAGGLAGGVPVRLPALVVRGVVLRLGHGWLLSPLAMGLQQNWTF